MRKLFQLLLAGVLILLLSGCDDGPVNPKALFDVYYNFENVGWLRVNDREIDVSKQPQEFDLVFKSGGIYQLSYSATDHNCSAEIIDDLTDIDQRDQVPTEYQYRRKDYIERYYF